MGKAFHPLSDVWNFAEELCEAVQAQQEQLQVLKEELAKRDRQFDEARDAAAAANACSPEESLACRTRAKETPRDLSRVPLGPAGKPKERPARWLNPAMRCGQNVNKGPNSLRHA